ncbi:MAG: type I-E CRISPR-associated protein Cas7/Cse4/CasC, partial [Clostridiaceae bacterium]|nr:type I-E CRISPR-associated protein Cas7/Cse4/CasC [Clostridiaceae bacterium]
MYVDMHVLQSVPPSCINRDDTGSPKTAIYGGSQRARISSQAWKKAMRDMFKKLFPAEKLGVRSKKVAKLIAESIKVQNPQVSDDDAMELARKVLSLVDIKL